MQQKDQQAVSPAVASGISPWRRRNPKERAQLLRWFLSTDLRSDAATSVLLRLTGRHVRLRARSRIPEGTETGFRRVRVKTPREHFVGYYQRVQILLRSIRRTWGEVTIGTQPKGDPVAAVARLQGERILHSELAEAVRLNEDEGARKFLRVALNSRAHDLLGMLVDWGRDLERDSNLGVQLPARPADITDSLVGELGLAMYEEVLGAKKAGTCAVCGRGWISAEGRGKRKLCDRDQCRVEWRRRTRKPEPPGSSTERVRRWRNENRRRRPKSR